MTLRIDALHRVFPSGEMTTMEFDRHVTIIEGPRNTSKTTSLKMMDFCLGDSDTAENALGAGPVGDYAALQLDICVGSESHRLRRSLSRDHGPVTKILVDEVELDLRSFQEWLMERLAWPLLRIPKGREARVATETVPLTFRSMLRHMYRKESSWMDIAVREEEFLRRAVTWFFLGLAPNRYSLAAFRAGEEARRVEAIRAALREADEAGEEIIQGIGRSIGLPDVGPENLESVKAVLRERHDHLQSQRQHIQETLEATPRFRVEDSEEYGRLDSRLIELTQRTSVIGEALAAYESSVREVEGNLARLSRAGTAIGIMAEYPVKDCPACGGAVPNHAVSSGNCYLCGQSVAPDLRVRRIELEKAALKREIQELHEVIERTSQELGTLTEERDRTAHQHGIMQQRLDSERARLLAPYVSELEALSQSVGAVEKQLETLSGLRTVTERRDRIQSQLDRALQGLEEAEAEEAQVLVQRKVADTRCANLADRMNDFLDSLKVEPWSFGRVTLAQEDLTLYVGTSPWQAALGAEATVEFMLAYHAALLQLPLDLPDPVTAPGLAILDNPMQHGIGDALVAEAVDCLAETARKRDGQLIVTLPRSVSISGGHKRIVLTDEYTSQD